MNNSIKREFIGEESIYVWDCPNCEYSNEDYEDPKYSDTVVCKKCDEVIQIED